MSARLTLCSNICFYPSRYDYSVFKCGSHSFHRRSKLWTANLPSTLQTSFPISKHDSSQPERQSFTEHAQWVHFIGVGGAGLSALAFYAIKQGFHVTGSDASWNQKMEELQNAGATVYLGHKSHQLLGQHPNRLPDFVVMSSAIPNTNEELVMARKLSIPVHKRGSWLAKVTRPFDVIAVSGSHGKSTTTAMLSFALSHMGNNISAIVGADVPQFPGGGGVMYERGSLFILEADEYDGCFLSLSPRLAIITNIDWEHVDMFKNQEEVIKCFEQFTTRIRDDGILVFCGDSPAVMSVAMAFIKQGKHSAQESRRKKRKIISYGIGKDNDWQAIKIVTNEFGGSDYFVTYKGNVITKVELKLPGIHNVQNSLAVIATVVAITGLNEPKDFQTLLEFEKEAVVYTCRSLSKFRGVRRRFEFVGKAKGCYIYDDYAHHPTEIKALLQAAKQKFQDIPVWMVFQPHTYSRLASLLEDIAEALSAADHIIVTEIYAARETNYSGISGEDIVKTINSPSAVYIQKLDDACTYLQQKLNMHAELFPVVVLTVGAGNITHLGAKLLHLLSMDGKSIHCIKYV